MASRDDRPLDEWSFDESELPILLVRYPREGGIGALEAAFEVYREVSRRSERVAYLLDMRRYDPIGQSAQTRRRAGELYERHAEELAKTAVCEARVVSNPVVKGVLVAFDWIKGDSLWPCRNFTDMDEARAWIAEQLEKTK